jgi:general secretion pathway protein G
MFTKKSTKGFTLIELLVVIAIIGILSSVVLASLNTARLKSRDTRRIADVKQLQLALALYFDSNASYPVTLSQLAPTYIAAIPTDPVGGGNYAYSPIGTGTGNTTCSSYHLGATLEELSNQALRGDIDAAAGGAGALCGTGAADFTGLAVTGGGACSGAAGTAQTTGAQTEACYDQKP